MAELERRVLDAALRCIGRWGVAKTTLEDVAAEAACSRATVYRLFPGGKDRLLEALVDAEVARFFAGLAKGLDRAAATGDVEDVVVSAAANAARAIRDHAALQFVLAFEPEAVLPCIAFRHLDTVLRVAGDFLASWLEPHVGAEQAPRAGEWLARIVLSYTVAPSADVDLTDEDSARRLLRAFVLPGLHAQESVQIS